MCEARRALQLQFVHLGTCVLKTGAPEGQSNGQTLWGGLSVDGTAGVAWGWIELQHGVFVLADPFQLITNLQLVGTRGEMLSGHDMTRRLNAIVHALPWQTEVQRVLKPLDTRASASSLF